MSEIDKINPVNPLNRRKPENRWRRILRDADAEQYEPVRRWLKLAKAIFEKDDDDATPRAA